ncbi:MAG: protein TolR [Hyphomicrobium sp.]|jgi:biopolymer transport protein TolR|nr:MAG: protein TolR [Hyphomicrobium sp.]PPC99267.1 MAG: protein TolR [Hyphomicrobium sp.]
MGMSVGNGSSGDDDSYKPLAEINVTPFVDVMLVLLIIFMVAAPLMVQGVPVDLPKTSASKVGALKKPMVVTLAADGNLYIRDEQVTKQTLVSRLSAIKGEEGADRVVYVRADRTIAYGEVMEVLGRVGESGFARVSLLSQPSPSALPAAQIP